MVVRAGGLREIYAPPPLRGACGAGALCWPRLSRALRLCGQRLRALPMAGTAESAQVAGGVPPTFRDWHAVVGFSRGIVVTILTDGPSGKHVGTCLLVLPSVTTLGRGAMVSTAAPGGTITGGARWGAVGLTVAPIGDG